MMDVKVIATLSFIGGAIVGAAATYIYSKKKNEELLNEQLQPVRDEFNKTLQKMEEEHQQYREKVEATAKEKHEQIKAVKTAAEDLYYAKKQTHLHLIDRGGEEFGGYMAVSLEYYSDGVLLDGTEIIDDASKDDLVGIENLALLCEAHPIVWVRNDNLKVDYEIAYIDEDFYADE